MRGELEPILRVLAIVRHELPLLRLRHMLSTDTIMGSKLDAELSDRFGPMTFGNIGDRNQREPVVAITTANEPAKPFVLYLLL